MSVSRLSLLFGSILIIVVGILLGASWYFSNLVLYPNFSCNPEHHVYCNDPSELGLPFEEVQIPTSRGLILNAWLIAPKNPRAAILLVHGHGGNRNEGLRIAKPLYDAGYTLLLLNLRRNVGGMATMGFLEKEDAKAGVTFLKEKNYPKIGILGFSMGAATSILAMAEDPRIATGLFSSGYSSAMGVLKESAKRDFGIPEFPLLMIVPKFIDFRADIQIDSVIPLEALPRIGKRPVAIFHCSKDDYVDSSHAFLFQKAAVNLKDFWIPECSRHEKLWNLFPEEAGKRTVSFFNKNL